MITEDYVSFETAKLLKEKGFDEDCRYFYDYKKPKSGYLSNKRYGENIHNSNDYEGRELAVCPTLQMAMKWLREVHNLVIEPYRTACGYLYTISSIPYGSTKYDNCEAYDGDDEDSGQWSTWEKACEDGIKYCLEKLI